MASVIGEIVTVWGGTICWISGICILFRAFERLVKVTIDGLSVWKGVREIRKDTIVANSRVIIPSSAEIERYSSPFFRDMNQIRAVIGSDLIIVVFVIAAFKNVRTWGRDILLFSVLFVPIAVLILVWLGYTSEPRP